MNNEYTLTVKSKDELPENILKFYDCITPKERIISKSQVGKEYIQVKTEDSETGLFRKDLLPEGGEMFLSWEKHSPLFVFSKGGITVIAPCEVQEAV